MKRNEQRMMRESGQAGAPQAPRRRWTLRTQLLLAVNLPLAAVLGMLLVLDYRREMEGSIRNKQESLQEEAMTIAQGLSCLSQQGRVEPIQRYVDNVCAGMQETSSPGHHIVVQLGTEVVQAQAHHQASPEMLQAMRNAAGSSDHRASFGNDSLVVGSFSGDGVEVYVSENTTNIRRSIQQEILWHLVSLAGLGLVAAGIVNVVLLRLVARPVRQLSDAVVRIAQGDYDAATNAAGSRELSELASAINNMHDTLASNERNRQSEMGKARHIQQHLLPNGIQVPGLTVAHRFTPADSVAGDYYDFMELPDGTWLLCVSDVTGHGVPAAMEAAMLKALVGHAAEHYKKPGRILQFVNRRLPDVLVPGDFASMFLARWHHNTGVLEYASAGHEPALLLVGQETRELKATGLLVGIDHDADWETERVKIQGGERLLIVTDGVVESDSDDGQLFGRQRLAEQFQRCANNSVDQTLHCLSDAIAKHRGKQPQADDVTMVAVEFDLPHGGASSFETQESSETVAGNSTAGCTNSTLLD